MSTKSIPMAKELPWIGGGFEMAGFTPDYLLRLARTYGPIVRITAFGTPIIFVAHPDLVHEILVEKVDQFPKAPRDVRILEKVLGTGLLISNGPTHRRRRRLMQPAFHMKRIQSYAEIMVDYTSAMLDRWQDGQEMDLSDEMMQLTLFIVAKSLFGSDAATLNDLVAEIETAVTDMQEAVKFDYSYSDIIPGWVPTASKRKGKSARAILDRVVERLIEEHRGRSHAEISTRTDLLSMLLLSEDEEGNRLDDAAMRDEVITLILAGHETTSNALTWTVSLLAQHPQITAQLHAELDAVLADEPLALETLPKLPYTLMVIKEALRLFPPAWALNGRQASADTQVGDYVIPKDTIVLLSPYVHHRLEEYFPEPDRFDPTRFEPQREKALPKHAYMPFGAGPRICIGNSFAMLEAQLILAAMVHRFDFALTSAQPVVPLAQITLMPRHGLPVRVTARTPQSARLDPAMPEAAPAAP